MQDERRTVTYFPFAHLPQCEMVVKPRWVRALSDFHRPGSTAPRPPTYQQRRFVILETSWATMENAKEYLAGHIPGAIHLDTDEIENGYPCWRLRSVAELQRVIGAHGIDPRTTVIVYSHQLIAAARVWWVLRYAGVADVRLLNGGLAAWTAAGYTTETRASTPRPAKFMARPRVETLAVTAQVRARDDRAILADTRSREEFAGEIAGYDYVHFKGRIPGALHIGNADDSSCLYSNTDGTLRDPTAVQAMWRQSGLEMSGREIIFYCGNGWRSSLAYLHAWLLGHARIRNYSDGWIGWSAISSQCACQDRRPARPAATAHAQPCCFRERGANA